MVEIGKGMDRMEYSWGMSHRLLVPPRPFSVVFDHDMRQNELELAPNPTKKISLDPRFTRKQFRKFGENLRCVQRVVFFYE